MDSQALLMRLQEIEMPARVYPVFRKIMGSYTGGALLSYLVALDATSNSPRFSVTNEKICRDTGLTTNELRTAKSKLKKMPFVSITREGLPSASVYEFDHQALVQAVANAFNKGEEVHGE